MTPGADRNASGPVNFRLLFESAPGLYLVLDTELRIVAVSDAYLQATITQRAEIEGRSIFDVFPDNPNDPAATGVRNLRDSLERVLEHRVPDSMAVQKYDIRRPESEGGGFEERYWSPANYPVFDEAGAVRFIIHRVEDVSEFVRLKQRRNEQEELTEALRSRGEQMESEIFRRAQEIQEANRQLREAKVELEERVQARTAELAHANEALRAEIDQSKRLEEQFRQAQKMEAVGTLAGGVAHDFNNLLTVISGYSEIVLSRLPAGDATTELVAEIQKAGSRATSLTRQLLAFSRQQVMEMKLIDLNSVIADTEKMLRRLIGEDISLTAVLDPSIGRIHADPGQIEQVIMNIAVNARDAMPQGGRLTIETASVELDESYAQMHLEVKPGPYVLLTMSDTGCGMDEATKARIFEPFFTTKGLGKGTGLGLATVFGSVKQCGGHIWVYSEPGQGTTFKIYLPRGEEVAPSEKPPVVHPPSTGNETILLVEDEDAVRAVTYYSLHAMGYQVLQASSGRDAIKLCREHQGPIHLLISDVVMPEMGGRKVAEAILGLRPGIKVLYLSGYTDDAVVRHGILQEYVSFLQKPFSPKALGRKVREVLR